MHPRFSLLSLILVTALIAVSISHWQTSRRARREINELQNRLNAATLRVIEVNLREEVKKLGRARAYQEFLTRQYGDREVNDTASNDLDIAASQQRISELHSEQRRLHKLIGDISK